MLHGSTWELSQAELREYQLCHGIDTILGSLYYLDPQTTQSPCGNLAAMSIPPLLLNTPSHQTFATFLPPHQQQYPAKGPDGFAPFTECICGHILPRRTFPCGSLHLPKCRCSVTFGMPWGTQGICTETADTTWDYRKPVPICTSGKKPGMTTESYWSKWLEHLTLLPNSKLGEWHRVLLRHCWEHGQRSPFFLLLMPAGPLPFPAAGSGVGFWNIFPAKDR